MPNIGSNEILEEDPTLHYDVMIETLEESGEYLPHLRGQSVANIPAGFNKRIQRSQSKVLVRHESRENMFQVGTHDGDDVSAIIAELEEVIVEPEKVVVMGDAGRHVGFKLNFDDSKMSVVSEDPAAEDTYECNNTPDPDLNFGVTIRTLEESREYLPHLRGQSVANLNGFKRTQSKVLVRHESRENMFQVGSHDGDDVSVIIAELQEVEVDPEKVVVIGDAGKKRTGFKVNFNRDDMSVVSEGSSEQSDKSKVKAIDFEAFFFTPGKSSFDVKLKTLEEPVEDDRNSRSFTSLQQQRRRQQSKILVRNESRETMFRVGRKDCPISAVVAEVEEVMINPLTRISYGYLSCVKTRALRINFNDDGRSTCEDGSATSLSSSTSSLTDTRSELIRSTAV